MIIARAQNAKLEAMGDFAKRTAALALEHLRADYRLAEFDEQNCETNWFEQFRRWFAAAQVADLKEPNAMSLATVAADGRPSNRVVLLKEVSEEGFVFYTSYMSRKGKELAANRYCAAVFLWTELERQVRVEGEAVRVSREQTERYFRTRPKGSRLGALVSSQSEVLAGRHILEEKLARLEAQYRETEDVPVPDYWGGYCMVPNVVEFWQGRTNRLHDRLRYRKDGAGTWRIERLGP